MSSEWDIGTEEFHGLVPRCNEVVTVAGRGEETQAVRVTCSGRVSCLGR